MFCCTSYSVKPQKLHRQHLNHKTFCTVILVSWINWCNRISCCTGLFVKTGNCCLYLSVFPCHGAQVVGWCSQTGGKGMENTTGWLSLSLLPICSNTHPLIRAPSDASGHSYCLVLFYNIFIYIYIMNTIQIKLTHSFHRQKCLSVTPKLRMLKRSLSEKPL